MLKVEAKSRAKWEQHQATWKSCNRCPLHENAIEYVLARGEIPAQILFIGEAPGADENACGEPFVGRAGRLFDELLADAMFGPRGDQLLEFTYCITNVVACFPHDEKHPEDTEAFRAPTKEEAAACSPRIQRFIKLVNPMGIILLGKVAEKHVAVPAGYPSLQIYHPSYLLRKGGKSHRNLDYKRTWVKLRNFVKEVIR